MKPIIINIEEEKETGFHATDAGERRIRVIYRDPVNDIYTEPVWIKRSLLAKLYSQFKVVGSRNGITVVDL